MAGGEHHQPSPVAAGGSLVAEAMRRGEWLVTHQGIAFDVNGVLVDVQHRLAAIIEADRPVELTVFTEVAEGTFDVLDIGKRRTAADVLAIEGEKNSTMLAAMVRTGSTPIGIGMVWRLAIRCMTRSSRDSWRPSRGSPCRRSFWTRRRIRW